jgi:hypothetical protein
MRKNPYFHDIFFLIKLSYFCLKFLNSDIFIFNLHFIIFKLGKTSIWNKFKLTELW